jgi:hypothetical protein
MDKRKSTLARTIYFHRGFFSNEIQVVLKKRKNLSNESKLSQYEKQLHLACPIVALSHIDEFTTNCLRSARAYEHPEIQYCYQIDSAFTAELLLAITLYEENNPEAHTCEAHEIGKVTLIEALLYFEPPDELHQLVDDTNKGGVSWYWDEISDWKSLAEWIGEQFPQHRIYATAARLKTEFSREKKRREKILVDWKSNIDAYWELSLSGNEKRRLFQVWENPLNVENYEKPSVTKTR